VLQVGHWSEKLLIGLNGKTITRFILGMATVAANMMELDLVDVEKFSEAAPEVLVFDGLVFSPFPPPRLPRGKPFGKSAPNIRTVGEKEDPAGFP